MVINRIYHILSNMYTRSQYNKEYHKRIREIVNWTYNDEDYSENNYALIQEGKHRMRIEKAEEQVARSSGNDMIKLTLSVSGYNSKLWKYIVLNCLTRENEKRTNRWLGSVFNSFSITMGNLDLDMWTGYTGGAMVRHVKDANGTDRAEVYYFLPRKDVDALPAWSEGASGKAVVDPDMVDFGKNTENAIPF